GRAPALARAERRLRVLQPARPRLPERPLPQVRRPPAGRPPPRVPPLPGRELPQESRPRAAGRGDRRPQALHAGAARTGLGPRASRGHRAIPGTKQRRYLEENARAAEITLTAEDLRALDAAAPRDVAAGARYPEP